MDAVKRIEKIINEKKWAKNNIGMGRVQCSKLMRIGNELILIIASTTTNKPIWARVEKILYKNSNFTIFYDGQYCEELNVYEYDEYKDYISSYEWNAIFQDNSDLKLDNMKLISRDERFCIDVYDNLDNYKEEFDIEYSKSINNHFSLI